MRKHAQLDAPETQFLESERQCFLNHRSTQPLTSIVRSDKHPTETGRLIVVADGAQFKMPASLAIFCFWCEDSPGTALSLASGQVFPQLIVSQGKGKLGWPRPLNQHLVGFNPPDESREIRWSERSQQNRHSYSVRLPFGDA